MSNKTLHVHCWQMWCDRHDCHTSLPHLQQKKVVKSYGIIAFSERQMSDEKTFQEQQQQQQHQRTSFAKKYNFVDKKSLRVLLIQRRHTNAFNDILMGRYRIDMTESDRDHLITLLSELTCDERSSILDCDTFDDFYRSVSQRQELKKIFCTNRALLCSLIASLDPYFLPYSFREFGFPKGRRERETNLGCALREFCEETGYKKSQIHILNCETTIDEMFIGSDGKHYLHSYYLACVNDPLNPNIPRLRNNEVKTVGWYSIEDAHAMLQKRSYDVTKCQALHTAHHSSKRYFNHVA